MAYQHSSDSLVSNQDARPESEGFSAATAAGRASAIPPDGSDPPSDGEIETTYDYRGPDGSLVYQVVRRPPKRFLQRRPDPDHPGEWIWDLKGVQPIPYRLFEWVQPVWLQLSRDR